MAGVKGRSGGARPNSGPKPRPPAEVAATEDPKDFLLKVMRGQIVPSLAQLDAAKTLAKLSAAAEPGKRAAVAARAKTAAAGTGWAALLGEAEARQ
jgi:phage terminase small subunit